MQIRRFQESDSVPLAAMIANTLRTVNCKDYRPEFIEKCVESLSAEALKKRASLTHFYVACTEDGTIIGSGAIGAYRDSLEESILLCIFTAADHIGTGVGRRIIETLEQDAYFLRAKRVEIPASVTGIGFYQKMGYQFKNGVEQPDASGHCRMEKWRTV